MKIFQQHDDHLDVTRTFLVLSMIFTHVFEMFYLPDYNRRLTYFVTLGFVFLSGFTIGALYAEKTVTRPKDNFTRMMKRATKLIIMFLVCNAIIFQFLDNRLDFFLKMKPTEMLLSIALGLHQELYGFDILIPIAFTTFGSFFLLLLIKAKWNWAGIITVFLLIITLEATDTYDFYGVILLLTGLNGCLLGKLSSTLNWDNFLQKMLRSYATTIITILLGCYYSCILLYTTKSTTIQVGYHVIPTILILFFIYLLSVSLSLNRNRLIQGISALFSNFMLFAYLFHILMINIFFSIFHKNSLNVIQCIGLGISVTIITGAACYTIKFLNLKSFFFSRGYSLLFKL